MRTVLEVLLVLATVVALSIVGWIILLMVLALLIGPAPEPVNF